jgi:hypothetical protein
MRIANQVMDLNGDKTFTKSALSRFLKESTPLQNKTFRLFPQFSLQYLLQSMGRIHEIKYDGTPSLTTNNSYLEWELETNHYDLIPITGDFTGNETNVGANVQPFTICFARKYYYPFDRIRLENGQILSVLEPEPVQVAANKWRYTVRLQTNDPNEVVDARYLVPGRMTSFMYSDFPELSVRGYMRMSGKKERHREYLKVERVSFSISGHAASTYYVVEDQNSKGKQFYFLNKAEKEALEELAYKKEMYLIYGKSSVDETGKCYQQDARGFDIISGNGIINQIDPSCKVNYTKLTKRLLQDIITEMILKSGRDAQDGVEIILMTGIHGYNLFQRLMEDSMKPGTVVYEKRNGDKITLGGNFTEYIFGKGRVILAHNSVFDAPSLASDVDENGHRLESYRMLFIDNSKYDGEYNIATFTRKGRALVYGELLGLGGRDGTTSGKIATSVDGSSYHWLSEIGVRMLNPYSSYMLEKVIV